MPTSSFKFAALAPLLALTACMGGGEPKASPYYAATIAPPPAPRPIQANGAIFQAADGYAPLTSGARAARVGDVLTIALVENTQAVKSSSQTSDHKGDIGITPPTTGALALFKPTDIGAGGDSSFQGKGQAQQSNKLSGEITVTIAEIYPNGTMLVRGEKLVTLNRGDEYIRVSGIVRDADITAENRIASTRVADARITYSGRGEVARASRQGWLQRFFNVVTPF